MTNRTSEQLPTSEAPDADLASATDGRLTRRAMLRTAAVGGAALPFLAACGSSDDSSGSGDSGSESKSSGSAGGGGGGDTVSASDVPVDGGTILKEQKVVVTQPAKGEYKAFSAVCTHQGCLVAKVENKEIVCDCHGSHFSISDGKPLSGPAKEPLASKTVSVKGGEITVG